MLLTVNRKASVNRFSVCSFMLRLGGMKFFLIERCSDEGCIVVTGRKASTRRKRGRKTVDFFRDHIFAEDLLSSSYAVSGG